MRTLNLTPPQLITDDSYPVLDAQVQIDGDTLLIFGAQGNIEIRAPKRYIRKLLEWCQGRQTMQELRVLSAETWGNTDFVDFLQDLIHAGVLSVRPAYFGQEAVLPLTKWATAASHTAFDNGAQALGRPPCLAAAVRTMLETVRAVSSKHSDDHCPHVHLIVYSPLDGVPAGIYAVGMSSQEVTISRVSSDFRNTPRAFNSPHILRNADAILVISLSAPQSTAPARGQSPSDNRILTTDLAQNLQLAASKLGICWSEVNQIDQQWLKFVCGLPQLQHTLLTGRIGLLGLDAACVSQPSTEIVWFNALERVTFHLAQAKIDWGSGRSSQGWGRAEDPTLTCDKAVAEAVERHAYSRYTQCNTASSSELDNVILPEDIVRYSRVQYRRKRFPFHRFSASEPRLWRQANDVNSGHTRWVLADCVLHPNAFHADYRIRLYTHATSSGCASAPTVEQATLNATLELIERDAFMQHWFAQCGGFHIPLKTLPSQLRSRLDLLHRSGCLVQVQCLHLGRFPMWMVLAQHTGLHFTCLGASCGLDAEAALESAISEMETQAHARLEGVPARSIRVDEVKSPIDHGQLYAMKPFFRKADALMNCTASKSYSKILPCFSVTSDQLFQHLEKFGNSPVWIDLSVPNAPKTLGGATLHTVRVIAPGLIPIAFGAGIMPLGMDGHGHAASRFPHPFM